ncbi:MAG TPA: ATP-dependent sacrificial sulfur transferase LarE [Gaiellaceae bacterium]|nr:ATP-dependent sacrificial sulfur transferase LarE [Gaiellaceae bacterium]
MTRIEELESRIRPLGSCIVAFSGGVDSSLVAALAVRALGTRALAVTAVSPALATGELGGARDVARAIGVRHEIITTAELEREGYRANDRDRCYHCKSELYERLEGLAARRGYEAVLSGANVEDLGDWRPGLAAAAEHSVLHPLVEAGVGKREVRELAHVLAIPSAEKPASPCLASRIPYGTAVDREVLARIDRAELAVKALGYGVLRVRHFGVLGRVELPEDALAALTSERRAAIAVAVAAAGYDEVEISDQPFRSGSLNASFTKRLAIAS